MPTLSPSGYQKVISKQLSMRRAPSPIQAPRPSGPSGTDQILGRAGGLLNLANTTNSLFGGGSNIGTALGGASSALNAVNAVRNFQAGRPFPGTMNALGAAGGALRLPGVSGLNFGGGVTAGQVGAGLGALGGLAGGAYGLAHGDVPGGTMGLISGVGGLASLAPTGATIGGVPIAGAGGAFGGALSGAAPSIAGAAGAMAIPFAVGKIAETVINAALGEGMFGETPLPFANRGSNWSSADNAASQISRMTGYTGANMLQKSIQEAPDIRSMLMLPFSGPSLSPHGEVQFYHPEYGTAGDWDDPQNPKMTEALQKIMATGDPDLMRKFISGIQVQTGEGGVVPKNDILTDWYRRKFVSLLPENSPLRQNMTGLFEPTPAEWMPETRGANYLDTLATLNQQYAGGPASYSREDAIRGLMAGNIGHNVLAPMFRPANEQITREMAERLVDASGHWDRTGTPAGLRDLYMSIDAGGG